MIQNCLKWFVHIHRRPMDAIVRRINLEVKGISKRRGRPKELG